MSARTALVALLACLAAHRALPSRALAQDSAPADRLSEAPVDLEAAWRESGFRLSLGFGYEHFAEATSPQRTRDVVIAIEPAVRLRGAWSTSILLRYGIASGDYEGIRWTVTPTATWHPSDRTWLSVGAGYGGLLLDASGFTSDYELECDGDGIGAIGRAGFAWQVGELFAHGPAVHADFQLTRCALDDFSDAVTPSSDVTLEGESERQTLQWRRHFSAGLVWMLTWR